MDNIKFYVKGIGTIEGDQDDIEMLAIYLDDAAAFNKEKGIKFIEEGNRELGEDHLDNYELLKDISENIRDLLDARR